MKISIVFPYVPIVIGAVLGAALGYFGQCTSGMCPLTSTWWRGAIYGAVLGTLFFFSARNAPARRDSDASPKQEQSPASAEAINS